MACREFHNGSDAMVETDGEFGKRVARRRQDLGLTKHDVAERIDSTGDTTAGQVATMENDRKGMWYRWRMVALAEALEIPFACLLGNPRRYEAVMATRAKYES